MAIDARVKRDPAYIVDPEIVIAYLEARFQPSAVRTWALTGDSTRLQEIEDDIVWLKSIVKQIA